MASGKKKVAYFYDPELGSYYYGRGHPMKPHRIRMAHNLILHYGLHDDMEIFKPKLCPAETMTEFHSQEYISFLEKITPENQSMYMEEMTRFQVGEDSPVFSNMFKYCQRYCGGSIGGAVKLNYGSADTVINWSGGLHHAKKAEASGFCFVNDIVLAILELLKFHQRVLYIDIDVHHGDGVEEAFLTTDRVMTVSLHKFGDSFFPGTGDLASVGQHSGVNYAMNIPLKDGMTDEAYGALFRPVLSKVMEVYQPEVIVFQSGADSLAGDMLGVFNLSMKGHADCLTFMQRFNVPMLVLGGGGYTINNVARCWAYETGRILGKELEDNLPENEYKEYFGPDYKLHAQTLNDKKNDNSQQYLENLKTQLLQNISKIPHAPSVGLQTRVPDAMSLDSVSGQVNGSVFTHKRENVFLGAKALHTLT